MVATTLEAGGLDPSVIVGGERIDTRTNARDGKGAWLVSEADESDLSFLNLRPEIAVVTNIENDHIASDAELPRLVAAFERFTANVPAHGLALIGIDEPRSALLAGRERSATTRTYGFDASADVRAIDARYVDSDRTSASRSTAGVRARSSSRSPAPSTCSTRYPPSRSACTSVLRFRRSPRRSPVSAASAGASSFSRDPRG
jgi:UDP-N-acetylmuramate-alanine ligase